MAVWQTATIWHRPLCNRYQRLDGDTAQRLWVQAHEQAGRQRSTAGARTRRISLLGGLVLPVRCRGGAPLLGAHALNCSITACLEHQAPPLVWACSVQQHRPDRALNMRCAGVGRGVGGAAAAGPRGGPQAVGAAAADDRCGTASHSCGRASRVLMASHRSTVPRRCSRQLAGSGL